MRVIVQLEQGRGRKIKRLIEEPLTGSKILRRLSEDKKGKRYRKIPTYV